MGHQYCPSCGSHDVELDEEGGMVCLDCGRHADNFPEEHMLIEDEADDEEMPIIKKSKTEEKQVKASKATKKAKKAPAKNKSAKTKKGSKK